MDPCGPTFTMTRFAEVSPLPTLRLEALGGAPPAGYTVRYVSLVGCTAATFTTTAETPSAGTPPRPRTWRLRGVAAPITPALAPTPSTVCPDALVSIRRAGVRGT
ncbi:hypothetical protein EAH86_08695 [Pedococcus bigeumensis]|uniref:Uncharacterized protein n=1 Tax=Pedococcus bigeumensis TaxID=433644 RepID=A0A502CW20_9MICO|nr:hypothetical protein EAH86_08695 [Pedococcus bigeumensis]